MRILLVLLFSGAAIANCVAGDFHFTPYAPGTMLPEPRYAYYNPSFHFLPGMNEYRLGNRVPLGLVSLFTFPERNPLLYAFDRDTFRERFDFFSMYDQLSYPTSILINPAQSPREVGAYLTADSLVLRDESGDSLSFETVAGGGGMSKPFSPLLPPPLCSYAISYGKLHSATSLFLSSTGHHLVPGPRLNGVLEGESIESSTRYTFSAGASAVGGIQESVSYGIPLEDGDYLLVVSPRLVMYYKTVTGSANYDFDFTTDTEGLPGEIGVDEKLFISHPGNGWGIGARADIGGSLATSRSRAGISFHNIIGVDRVKGESREPDGSFTPETITNAGSDPVAVITASRSFEFRRFSFLVAADTEINERPVFHGSLTIIRGMLMLRTAGGYKGSWESTTTVGLKRQERRIALSINLHSSPFTRRPVVGVGLQGKLRK